MLNNTRIQILDCTLRDGGFALEDAENYNDDLVVFDSFDREAITLKLIDSKIDYLEIGAVELSDNDKKCYAIYKSIEEFPNANFKNNANFALMFRGPDTPISDIPTWNESLCQFVRVILRYSELKKSIDFCYELSKKGYKVFIQPMVTLRYTESELDYIIKSANRMNAYALYFVDSYGYMSTSDIQRLFKCYDEGLDEHIKIGFHSHNNMNLAFSNVIDFIGYQSDRSIIIDSTCLGMGQGAGNMQTEILTHFLNESYQKEYDYLSVLDVCEIIEKYNNSPIWGYSLPFLLPAQNRTAYKFALAMRKKYNLHYRDIYSILANIPEKYRHRYSQDNIRELLNLFGYELR